MFVLHYSKMDLNSRQIANMYLKSMDISQSMFSSSSRNKEWKSSENEFERWLMFSRRERENQESLREQ